MALAKMKKISVCARKKNRSKILDALQRMGVMEIETKLEEDFQLDKTDTTEARASFLKQAVVLDNALKVLARYAPEKKGLLGNVLRTLAECVRFVAVLIQPVMPSTPGRIFEQLGLADENLKTWDSLQQFGTLPQGLQVHKGDALFPRIDIKKELEALNGDKEEKKEEKKEAKPAAEQKPEKKEKKKAEIPEGCIAFDDFAKIQLRVARVITCERVEKSEKLLKFRLSLGTEERTVLSGIAKFHTPEELVGKKLILLANLAPRKIMGIESQGMLLSAVKQNDDGTETLRLLTADPIMPDGAEIG